MPAPAPSSHGKPDLRIVLSSLGRLDVEATCRLTLPSLLGAGNLPRLEARTDPFPTTICCLSNDKARFEQDEAFRSFAKDRSVDWHILDRELNRAGGSREVVLTDAFRAVVSTAGSPDSRGLACLLLKPGLILADGGLACIADALARGKSAVVAPTVFGNLNRLLEIAAASGGALAPREIVEACCNDPTVARSSFSGVKTSGGYAASDRLSFDHGDGRQTLMSARWHPIALRPRPSSRMSSRSILDADIMPEFVDDETEVFWARHSDELLLVEPRSDAWLSRRFAVEGISDVDVVARIKTWATPWQRRALARRFQLHAPNATSSPPAPDPFAHLAPPLALEAASGSAAAEPNPIWLAALGFRLLSPALGVQKRYQSDLDEYYRASRRAIEASPADEVIYVGYACHVFAGLLARMFQRAYLADLDRLLARDDVRPDPAKTTLCVVHIDLRTFLATFLSGRNDDWLLALARQGTSLLMIVEAPDSQGGLDGFDRARWRTWFEKLRDRAGLGGAQCRISPTIIDFFHGHPGFIVGLEATGPKHAASSEVAPQKLLART